MPPLLAKKKQSQKIRPKNSGPKFGRPKFVSRNSALNSSSGGAKSPVQTFVPEGLGIVRQGKWPPEIGPAFENLSGLPPAAANR